jgi:metallo-beta-lactamase family protein
MKIYFHGATGDVTGSAYHVKTKHASVPVDCGLFQGGKEAGDNIEV